MIGGLGVQELLIVLVIALFLFGGKKLPEIGQSLGKALRGFKEGSEGEDDKVLDEASKSDSAAADTEVEEAEARQEEVAETPASEEAGEGSKEPGARSQEPE